MGRRIWTDEMKARYPKKYAEKLARGWTPEELKSTEMTERRERPPKPPHHTRAATRLHRLKTYGLTVELMESMLIKQGNACAICSNDFKDGVFVVDHCHAQGHVRGLLCYRCNTALGGFGDRADLLESAARYLRSSVVPEKTGTQ